MMNFCPHCAAALTTVVEGGRRRPACRACGFVAYHNPAPVVMALVRHSGQILLVQRGRPPLAGWWAPPAGYVEYEESLEEALHREVAEETGLTVAVHDLAGVWSQHGTGVIFVGYNATVTGGEPRPGDDALAVGFFDPAALPPAPAPAAAHPLDAWYHAVLRSILGSGLPDLADQHR